MLDVSEAIQRRNRPGMQHRRGPASSSPMHVSSPVRSQAPQSPAPHQSANVCSLLDPVSDTAVMSVVLRVCLWGVSGDSYDDQACLYVVLMDLGAMPLAPALCPSYTLRSTSHAQLPKPLSPMHVASAPQNSSAGQLPKPLSPLRVPRSPGAAREAPTSSAAQQMQAPDQAEQTQAAQSASANGSVPAGVMHSKAMEDMPGVHCRYSSAYEPCTCMLPVLLCAL